jgi:hypothetical protein
MKRKAGTGGDRGKQTAPTIYYDGSARAKSHTSGSKSQKQAHSNPLLTMLDDKARMVESLKAVGISNVIPTHCFESIDDAIEFCANTSDKDNYVLKAATSCDSLDVTFGTTCELKKYLIECKKDKTKVPVVCHETMVRSYA